MPASTEAEVLRKSARRCMLCFHLNGDLREKHGQVAHLDRDPNNNAPENLAFMCLEHHSLYDSTTSQHKNYSITEIKHERSRLYRAIRNREHLRERRGGKPALQQVRRPKKADKTRAASRRMADLSEGAKADPERPCFSLRSYDGEIHSYTGSQFYFSIRNCGGRTARDIRFDPVFSASQFYAIRFNTISSLAAEETVALNFSAGADASWLHKGTANRLISFFSDDNPQRKTKLIYIITVRFLDGTTERAEQHRLEGEPLAKGGVRVRVSPIIGSEAFQPEADDLPAQRPIVIPKRYGPGILKNHMGYTGLAVINDGTPAYDISIANVSLGSQATIEFHCGRTERLSQDEGETFYPAFIQARLGGTFGSALFDFMVKEGVPIVVVPITYRDQDSRWYQTDVRLARDAEKSGGLRLEWKQRRIPTPVP
jgi:hypothetical protein